MLKRVKSGKAASKCFHTKQKADLLIPVIKTASMSKTQDEILTMS